jgi:hypothetical protein
MRYAGRRKLIHGIAGATIAGVAMLAANSGVALAAYGPTPRTGPVSGGFYCIVTSQTVGPAGKFIGSLGRGGLGATIRIPRGAFPFRVQFTVSEPDQNGGGCQGGLAIGNGGFPGYVARGGVGILVQRNGTTYRRKFAKPLTLRMSLPSGSVPDHILVWGGRGFTEAPATVRHASATVRVARGADYAVLVQATRRRGSRAASALQAAAPARDLLVAALLRPAGAPRPGLGVLRAPRLAAVDTSITRRS